MKEINIELKPLGVKTMNVTIVGDGDLVLNKMNDVTAKQLTDDTLHAIKGIGRRALSPARLSVEALPVGHGGIVELDGEKTGVYRTEDGTLLAVSIKCPHLGCQLEWNPDEKSWDCPCHGSRFDVYGRLLDGPAQSDLK